MSTVIDINQSITLPFPFFPPIKKRKLWVPYVTDLSPFGTLADGVLTQFIAPKNWSLSVINGTRGIAFTKSSVFEYVTSLPTVHANYFTVAASLTSPTGYVATFSSQPVPDTIAGDEVPTALVYSYSNFEPA